MFADKEFPLDALVFSLSDTDGLNGPEKLVARLKPDVVAMSKTILPMF